MTLLTVIVPTIPSRQALLSRLLFHLGERLDDRAEVFIMAGPGGMGTKVTAALQRAKGRMSVVIDDDDLVPTDYTRTICDVIAAHDVDFIGHRILRTVDGHFAQSFVHRNDGATEWGLGPRGVTPKCPFRTELTRDVLFGNDYTADRRWSSQMHLRCVTGVYLDRHMYHQDHRPSASAFIGDHTHDVGHWPYDAARFQWWTTSPS
jgi:hypothetical protein